MQFLYPLFLWGLLAIAIPIIIHLFHFRRFKKVYFPNVKFLRELQEETSSRNRLKNLLVLLARILAVASLVLAFAQPFIPQSDEVIRGSRAVSLFVDNSFSMSARGENIDLLTRAKLDAMEVIKAYETTDAFQVLTHDFNYSQMKWLTQEQAMEVVEGIEITHEVQLLSQVMQHQQTAFRESKGENYLSYWISDFQRTISDIDESRFDTTVQYNIVYHPGVETANLSIDSCWWVAPIPVKGQQGSLIVKLHNYGDQDIEDLTVNLFYNQQNYPLARTSVSAGQTALDTLKFTLNRGGWSRATVSLTDYPVRFDDEYHIAFEVSENIPVLVISEDYQDPYLRAVFETSAIFDLDHFPATNIDYSSLGRYKLIILRDLSGLSSGLSESLENYAKEGGNLLVFPGRQINLEEYNSMLKAFRANLLAGKEEIDMPVGTLNEEEFVFRDVFEKIDRNIRLPEVKMRYTTVSTATSRNRQVLAFRDGKSCIDAYETGDGYLYFSSVPLDPEVNELVRMAEIFVPMVYRMALSSNVTGQIAYTIGLDRMVRIQRHLQGSEIPYRIEGPNDFIPGIRNLGPVVQLDVQDQVKDPGFYSVMHQQDTVRSLAFNYDRRESDLRCLSRDELLALIGGKGQLYDSSGSQTELTRVIESREKGILLWKWFIILALLFLAFEIVFLRAIKL
jgi:hypothetical protein